MNGQPQTEGFIDQHPDVIAKTAAAVTIEHFGAEEWNDDATTFVINALSPAKVSRVSILDEEQRIMEVVVEDKQLSLAIGKKGQNVRLAAKLVG